MYELFGGVPGNFSVLEEQIDIDLQMEYFEVSKRVKVDLDEKAVIQEKAEIFNLNRERPYRQDLFAKLASIENVEAFRVIERYIKEEHKELRSWAVLALQESRMLLESRLLDENQVFISTGLGGKGSKLRYFVVLILKEKKEFSDLQKKILKNEFEIMLKKHDAEIEDLQFYENYATLLAVLPLKVSLKGIFRGAIRECNQYGNFLRNNFIVTNVRILKPEEISEFLMEQGEEGS